VQDEVKGVVVDKVVAEAAAVGGEVEVVEDAAWVADKVAKAADGCRSRSTIDLHPRRRFRLRDRRVPENLRVCGNRPTPSNES